MRKLATRYYPTYVGYKIACARAGVKAVKRTWWESNTLEGYLENKYRTKLKCRVNGTKRGNGTLCKSWVGQTLCTFENFRKKSLRSRNLVKVLWPQYIASNRNEELAPSVDRIVQSKGYALSNIRWITKRQNTLKAASKRRKNRIEKRYEA